MDNIVKRILLVNDTYDDNNLGCKATTVALYNLLEAELPHYEISDVIKLYHTERSDIIPFLPDKFEDIDEYCTQWFHGKGGDITNFEIQRIKRCDVVVINGEGSIYKNVVKCRYQLFLAYLSKVYYKKKVYIVNHTADISMIPDWASKVYSVLDGIVVREPVSKHELESIGIKGVKLAPDAVFSFDINDFKESFARLPIGFDINKKFIMVGGSSLNHPIYEKWNGVWDMSSFKKLIMKLRDELKIQILIVDVGGDDFLRFVDTEQNVFYGKFSFEEYLSLSRKSLLHLSGRHHGSCLAAIAGCPLIGITANTKKMEGDFQLLDWQLPIYNFYTLNENLHNIVEVVKEVITNNIYFRNLMKENVRKITKEVNLHAKIIVENNDCSTEV